MSFNNFSCYLLADAKRAGNIVMLVERLCEQIGTGSRIRPMG